MYPPVIRKHNPSCTPREFVDLLDKLIGLRVTQNMLDLSNHQQDRIHQRMDEEAELVMRQLTDYLLVNSKEVGLAVHGDHR